MKKRLRFTLFLSKKITFYIFLIYSIPSPITRLLHKKDEQLLKYAITTKHITKQRTTAHERTYHSFTVFAAFT